MSDSSSGKALVCVLGGPGSIPGVGGVEIFLQSFVSRLGSTQTPVKMSTGGSPRGQRRPSVGLTTLPLPNAVAVYLWTLASTSSWAFMACNGDILPICIYIYIYIYRVNQNFCYKNMVDIEC